MTQQEIELILTTVWLQLLITFMISSIVGSFLNVVLYRLPIIIRRKRELANYNREPERYIQPPTQTFNLSFPLSHCPQCKTPIRPWHNIPILSWILLRGKSACCNKPIPVKYIVVEVGYTALGLVLTATNGFNLATLSIMASIFAVATMYAIDKGVSKDASHA